MYKPLLKTKQNGVPILNKEDIDIIREKFVMDFQPQILSKPGPLDIEAFMENYLKLTPDYLYLSNNGCYLGMIVFNDNDIVVAYDKEKNDIIHVKERANTVIIDNSLLAPHQEHRYRFTLGHEVGHFVLHYKYYAVIPNQVSIFCNQRPSFKPCCMDNDGNLKYRKRDDHSWMEIQANRFSAAILMPKSALQKVVERNNYKKKIYALFP